MAAELVVIGNKGKLPAPWERQTKESDVAFAAFVTYRDMAVKRTVTAVAKELSKSRHLIDRWKQRHRWEERVIAWDNEQDRITREALTKGITQMRKNHTNIAGQMLLKALQALQSIPAAEMTMQDIARAVDVAAKLERLSRGEVTERTENRNDVSGRVTVTADPYGELSTEELRNLARLADDRAN